MQPFPHNISNLFSNNHLPQSVTDLANLSQLQNLQNFQNLQRLQLLQGLQNGTNNNPFISLLASKNIPSLNLPSLVNVNPLSTRANVTQNVLQKPESNQNLISQVTNLMMTWKMQSDLQSELYNNQLSQLLEMQKQLDQKMQETKTLANREPLVEVQKNSPVEIKAVETSLGSKKTLKSQIRSLLHFVLQSSGRVSDVQIAEERNKYKENHDLVTIYDALINKYSSTIKTKEEMIKYTLRKVFKFLKNQIKKEKHLDSKEASTYLCQRYFKDYTGKMPDLDNEDDFLKFILPFRKNSKNKTMNSSFIHEVFASNEFKEDYIGFLEDIDEILETDNSGKIDRFVSFIEENLKKNKIPDIKSYKRIPWPQLWTANTKKIAIELPDFKSHETSDGSKKKTKKSADLSNHSETSELAGTTETSPSVH